MKSWAQGVQGTPVLYMANWASRPPRIWECPQVVSGRVSYVTWTLWTLWPKHSEHNWRLTVQQAILLRLLPQPAPLFFFFLCVVLLRAGHSAKWGINQGPAQAAKLTADKFPPPLDAALICPGIRSSWDPEPNWCAPSCSCSCSSARDADREMKAGRWKPRWRWSAPEIRGGKKYRVNQMLEPSVWVLPQGAKVLESLATSCYTSQILFSLNLQSEFYNVNLWFIPLGDVFLGQRLALIFIWLNL